MTAADTRLTAVQVLSVIAKFPMVTIEKWQGDDVVPALFEEQAWVVAAAQVKKLNPKATVVVWLDSFRIYTSDKKLNPDLTSSCTTGHFKPAEFLETDGKMNGVLDPKSRFLLKNASGLPALESWSKCHIFVRACGARTLANAPAPTPAAQDHTKAVARQYWTEMCLNLTKSGVIDGCGADASWQTGVDQAKQWGLAPAMAASWDSGHKQMMRETTAALDDGVLLGKDPWEVGDYVNGALHEGCAPNEETILTLQNLTSRAATTRKRLIYQCHSNDGHDVNRLAAFLIGAGKYHYYGCGGWTGAAHEIDSHRPPELDKPLGPPAGPGTKDPASGVWSRSFGTPPTKVTFDPKTNTGSIAWSSGR